MALVWKEGRSVIKKIIKSEMVKPRALVVDDEESLAEVTRAILIKAGLDVRVAYDGADSFKVIDEFSPDIIVTDVRMPEVRGDEMLVQLRHRNFEKPVIIYTGYGEESISLSALDNGAFAILHKPVANNILITVVESALRCEYERLLRQELLALVHGVAPAAAPTTNWERELIRDIKAKINTRRAS